jgi:hypothetical protein
LVKLNILNYLFFNFLKPTYFKFLKQINGNTLAIVIFFPKGHNFCYMGATVITRPGRHKPSYATVRDYSLSPFFFPVQLHALRVDEITNVNMRQNAIATPHSVRPTSAPRPPRFDVRNRMSEIRIISPK